MLKSGIIYTFNFSHILMLISLWAAMEVARPHSSLAEDKESKDHIIYLPSIDNIALRDKRKTSNALSQELDYYIYDMKTGPSLMSLRMSMLDSSEEKRIEMKAKIADFQKIINDFFAMTGKRIEIEGSKFSVLTDTGVLPVESLSLAKSKFY